MAQGLLTLVAEAEMEYGGMGDPVGGKALGEEAFSIAAAVDEDVASRAGIVSKSGEGAN